MSSSDTNPFSICTEVTTQCPISQTVLSYRPNLGANAFFIAVFILCAMVHLIFGIRWRTWTFMLALFLGSVCEAIGYAGRILLYQNAWNVTGFEIQIICLIIAPAFVAAGVYLSLKHFVLTFGEQYSLIKPNWYTWGFITADIISLVMQGAGGAITATSRNPSTVSSGENIAIAGICWQVFSLAIFGTLSLQYVLKVYHHRCLLDSKALGIARSARFQFYCVGLVIAFSTILIRCIYRIPELAGGWRNPVMLNEVGFIVLDGVMITVAVSMLTVAHPGYCFPKLSKHSNHDAETQITQKESIFADGSA